MHTHTHAHTHEHAHRIMGAEVVLTEQNELVALLRQNLQANFQGDTAITAAVSVG